MRQIHISTVGKSPEPIINGFRHHSVDHQVLLHSAETFSVARKIKERLEDLAGRGICELVEIDPFDMHDIIAKTLGIWKRFRECEILINITGGTNVMASSALVACFTIGGKAYYIKEAVGESEPSLTGMVVELPVPKVPLESLSESQRAILKYLREHGGRLRRANVSIQNLPGNPSAQLVSYHLKKLEQRKLIDLELDGREKTAILTDSGRLYAELV